MSEIIPIPERRARQKRPIHLEFTPQSFPHQRFALRLDWNDSLGNWVVEIEHISRDFHITKGVATPYRPYNYMPYLVFFFADPSGQANRVTPQNLGDEVQFFVLPGPSGKAPDEEE